MDSLQQTAEGTPCTRGQCVVASRVTPSMAHRQGSWRLSHVSRNLRLNDAVDWSSTRHRLARGALSTAAFSVLCALHGAHAQVDTNRFCRDRNPKITTIVYNGQGATCAPSTVLVDGKPPAVVCSRSEQATTDTTGALGFAAGLTGTPRTWTYTYTTYGRVLTATDPNGKTTTTSYYPDDDPDMGRRGNVASVTNAANHVTRFAAYNLHGQPTQIVDPNGLVTDLTYDLRLRLTSRKVGNELTTFSYEPTGLLKKVTLPDHASVTYTYDAAHRLIAIADQQGNRIDYTLDAMGNRISEKTSDNSGTLVRNIQRTIDALNRVQQIIGAQ